MEILNIVKSHKVIQ